MLVLSLLVCISSASAVNLLTCSPSNFTCPGSIINCECQARSALRWIVTPQVAGETGEELLRESYLNSRDIGVVTSMNGYTVVLCSVDTSGVISLFTSKLNFTLTENVSVTCEGTSTVAATLQTAGPPSPPVNLQYTLKTTATDSTTVKLDWDPPLDDGGVAITHYQISVNMSERVITTDTLASFTLNSRGEHQVQVRAVNCAGVSEYIISLIILTVVREPTTSSTIPTAPVTTTVTTTAPVTTTEENFTIVTLNTSSTSPDVLLALNTTGVTVVVISLLVVIAVVYTCGVLTGLLVQRKKRGKSSPTSASGDPVPMYEEVVLPTQKSISLKENVSYGHFKPTVL